MSPARFYLGASEPSWLESAGIPLFISRRRLQGRKERRPAHAWALDSGAFTELQKYGGWTLSARAYAREVWRYRDMGRLEWAAPQDWMCEPFMVGKTGLSVTEHQELTVRNLLDLRMIDSTLPFIPVLQGYARDDYLRCADMYAAAGVDLESEAVVGLGSVCRRQATDEILDIIESFPSLRLHGFGVKTLGLRKYGHLLSSSDSMAWSFQARYEPPMHGCYHGRDGKGNCSNCLRYAKRWWARVYRAQITAEESHDSA